MKTFLIRRQKGFFGGNRTCEVIDLWVVLATSIDAIVDYFGFVIEWNAGSPQFLGVKLPRSSFSPQEGIDAYEKHPIHLGVAKNSEGDVYFEISKQEPFSIPK